MEEHPKFLRISILQLARSKIETCASFIVKIITSYNQKYNENCRSKHHFKQRSHEDKVLLKYNKTENDYLSQLISYILYPYTFNILNVNIPFYIVKCVHQRIQLWLLCVSVCKQQCDRIFTFVKIQIINALGSY